MFPWTSCGAGRDAAAFGRGRAAEIRAPFRFPAGPESSYMVRRYNLDLRGSGECRTGPTCPALGPERTPHEIAIPTYSDADRLAASAALGVVLYLTGVFLFALNDALGKWLVADYGVGQLMFVRSIGSAFVLAPMALALKPALAAVENPPLQVLRVLAMAADTFAFYWATRYMPLADVMTFYMAAPLIMTALSAPLLGEKVERFRWVAVLVGFAGVVVALRPTPQLFSWASLLALFGATMFALGQTLTRKLRRSHWLQLTIWQFVGGGLIGAATIPFAWTTPRPSTSA